MKLVAQPIKGYDPDLRTTYTAYEYEHEGHAVFVTQDRYGTHIKVDDGGSDKTATDTSDTGLVALLAKLFGGGNG
jgi:hypothetical protein